MKETFFPQVKILSEKHNNFKTILLFYVLKFRFIPQLVFKIIFTINIQESYLSV